MEVCLIPLTPLRRIPMPRINPPAIETAIGATAKVYTQIKKAAGTVPNTFAAIGALAPAALDAILPADGVRAAGSLSKQDQAPIKLPLSEIAASHSSVAPHTLLPTLP